MGDMADWINDNGMIEDLLYGEGGLKKCKYCGEEVLWWENFGSRSNPRYLLVDDKGLHQCSVAGHKLPREFRKGERENG